MLLGLTERCSRVSEFWWAVGPRPKKRLLATPLLAGWQPAVSRGFLLVSLAGLTACGAALSEKPSAAMSVANNASTVGATASSAQNKDLQSLARQPIEQRLLQQAEEAFRRGNLIDPAHDNAYDRFHSVLKMNPSNTMARSGLQAILIRYADLIRDALARSRYDQARRLLKTTQIYYPGNTLLLDLKQQLLTQERAALRFDEQVLVRTSVDDLKRQDFALPVSKLGTDDAELAAFLTSIAQRIKVSDESILIYARTDSEGRWLYRTINAAVPDYRVRGDIRIARSPKITILPPL